jgi:uncharacterized membrane protein YphA (DoxX/SURF4 family)
MALGNERSGAFWRRAEDAVARLSRLVLAGVFLYAARHKIADPFYFMEKVHEYDLIPATWVEPVAYALPWAEIAGALLLLLGLFTRVAGGGLGLMLLSFIIPIGVNIYRDRVLGCGCFSEEGNPIGWGLVLQDLVLLASALFLVLRGSRRFALDRLLPWARTRTEPTGKIPEHPETEREETKSNCSP